MMAQDPRELPQEERRRHARQFQIVSLAAAILVIGALVVASVLLFNRYRRGNEAQQGTHPISVTLSSCDSLPWPAFVDLCTHHQFQDLLQRRTMGDYVLVVERAYLDMNQLVMSYRVFSQSTGQQMLADLDTVITSSQGQSFPYYAGGWVHGGPQVDQFSTPPVPAQTRALQFHVEVNGFRLEDLASPGTAPASHIIAVKRPVNFDFTLEYHEGLVVTPHQTVMMNALSVTLERVRLSPSATILEGTTKGTVPSSPQVTFSLNAAGRSPDSLASSSFGFGGESTPFSAEYYDGLLGQHGTWTFDIAGPGEGSWEFRFSVP